jgi:glutaredoxin-dependent peroxiredoxin
MNLINTPAPAFSLFNTFKKEVVLSEQRGSNVVLLFFPLAFTSTCTAELCNIRDNYRVYEALNAKVFGISIDSLYCLGKFREEQNLQFDLLSDFNRQACSAYDCKYDTFSFGMKDVPKRATFVIDAGGIIRHAEVLEVANQLPDFQRIQDSLKALEVA